MKFLRDLFYKTFIGRLINTFRTLYNYLKDYEYIADTLYSEAFKLVLKEYLNVDIRKDWIGRLYGVINPNINKEGQFDVTKTIIELLTGNKKFDVDEKFDKEGLIKFIESTVEIHSEDENALLESLENGLQGNCVFKEDIVVKSG